MSRAPLYTIGYEGSALPRVLRALEAAAIDLVIDVRQVPWSRKPGFSKSALERALTAIDVGYLHLVGLGDPKAGRLAARAGRHDEFLQLFAAHMATTGARVDLARAISAARDRTACLLCFERRPEKCHRAIVADAMVDVGGFALEHLDANVGAPPPGIDAKPNRHDGPSHFG
jgi:uncharacterized protein (DUF488 family)